MAVDFSKSNGDLKNKDCLHLINDDAENEYVLAIKSVGEIIEDYDTDKQFVCLGFGAQAPQHKEVTHDFFLTLDGK